jgi:hypothetical protein
MPDSVTWTGASGAAYIYYIYPNPPNFSDPSQDGNYIYAKIVNNLWVPIYIGQGCLQDRCCANHHKAICITEKGATHVHAHIVAAEASRLAEEADLLTALPQAYTPTGCNER